MGLQFEGQYSMLEGLEPRVYRILGAVDGKTFAKELKETVVAVAWTKLKVIQCLLNMLFSGCFGNSSCFG